MEEIWKAIDNYSDYEVSNKGRVKNIVTGKILKPILKGGYNKVQLFKDSIQKKPSIHRLVAKAFIENPLDKPDIHHIDHNKSNNGVDNLMWVTPQENNSYNLCNPFKVVNHRPKSIASVDYYEINGALFRSLHQASKKLKIPIPLIKKLCLVYKTKGFRYIAPKYY